MTTFADSRLNEVTVADTYRAKDIEMAAKVDTVNRLVLVTGAIDTNEHSILVRIELPSAGRWQVIKSETNLTDRSWTAWQVSLGEGTTVAGDAAVQNLSRQFEKVYVPEDRSRITFYGGEVRPGEAILKMYTLDAKVPRIVMAHARELDEGDDEPDEEVPAPPEESELPEARIRRGLPAKPYIEVFLPVTLIDA
ncbi:MAG TPA: DUF6423 family protein [Streptosporangiaceae bacterium]|nr:DUF6423 family protein [Streptosporangiaceae bacterium]